MTRRQKTHIGQLDILYRFSFWHKNREERIKNKKEILELIGSFLLFIAVIISVACVVKYAADHRCLTYEELPEDAIVFYIVAGNTAEGRRKAWEYDVSGNLYISVYVNNEINNSVTEELISREIVENCISSEEVGEMYKCLFHVNKNAREELLSNRGLCTDDYTYFGGTRYLANGEVEKIFVGSGQGGFAQKGLKDTDAREILNWLMALRYS